MGDYPYSSGYPYGQPQGAQRRQAQPHQPQPHQHQLPHQPNAAYRSVYPQQPQSRSYVPTRHVQTYSQHQQYAAAPPPPPPPPPQGPPPPSYGTHATYTTPFYNDHRDIRTDMRDLRDIDFPPYGGSGGGGGGPPTGPPGVTTSDAYAAPQMQQMQQMQQPSPSMYWGQPGDNAPPPPPPQGRPGVPPPPPPQQQQAPPQAPPVAVQASRPMSQTEFNAQASHPHAVFNEETARTTATATFDRFDQDRGNYLDLQEFMDALRALHLAITYHDAMDCFARADHNCDGRITKEEFIRVYIEEMRKSARY